MNLKEVKQVNTRIAIFCLLTFFLVAIFAIISKCFFNLPFWFWILFSLTMGSLWFFAIFLFEKLNYPLDEINNLIEWKKAIK